MRPRALAAAAVVLAVTLGVLMAPAPVQAAAADGTLSITMVDENGAPMPGSITLYAAGGQYVGDARGESTLEQSVPPGTYGIETITPWGAYCLGLTDCDFVNSEPDGSVVVASGETTELTVHGEVPAELSGVGRVGTAMTLDYSTAMTDLLSLIDRSGNFRPTITWLRNGAPIGGTNDESYTPVLADAGQQLSVELSYAGEAQAIFTEINGGPVEPRTTNAVAVAKVATRTFAIVANPKIKVGSRGKVRVEVTAPGQIVTGKVSVKVGSWSQTRSLINGGVLVRLPRLPVGEHDIIASFLGGRSYAASTAKPRSLTVTNR